MASASVMYFPCFVFPYQRVPGLWYTPESVFTHTMPALFAGGACCAVAGLEAGVAPFAELDGVAAAGAVAGLLDGVVDAAGVAAGVVAEAFALVAAGADGAVEAVDFLEFERVFFGALEFSAAAVPAAAVTDGFEAAVVFDFIEGFFAAAELSAVAVLSAASVLFGLVLLFEDFAFESLLL